MREQDLRPLTVPRGLRVGLVAAPDDVRAWMVTLVDLLEAGGQAHLAAVITVGSAVAGWVPPDAGPIQRALVRIDDRLFGRPGDPLSRIDLDRAWPTVPRFDVDAMLVDAPLDIIIQPMGRPVPALARLSRHGVWVIEHGDTGGRPVTPGLMGVLHASDVLRSELVALDAAGRRTVLARTWSAPDPSSARRSMNHVLAKVAAFPARQVARLVRSPDATLDDLAIEPPTPARSGAVARASGTDDRAIARALPGHLARFLTRLPERFIWRPRWILAELRDVPEDAIPDPTRDAVALIRPPAGVSWADPFPIDAGGRSLLFIEEWSWSTRKGRIALLTREIDGSWSNAGPVLEREVHLSYPFVFTWDGEWYLMPEAAAGRTLDLYRATDFPMRWTFDRHVMEDVRVADATIAEIDGAWWMFATIAADGAASTDELHLFSGPGPLGPWEPHRDNPVVSDVRSARPAGWLFRHAGAWYRPSQDCTQRYGRAIVLSRIERLDMDGYREQVVGRIEPDWTPGALGTHTLNRAGRSVLLDVSVRDAHRWSR